MASANDSKWQKDAADQNFDYMFKLLIIGNSSVGKTSFLFRYADDSFTSAFVSTVGIDFKVKTVFRQDKRVKLQIWVRIHSIVLALFLQLQIWVRIHSIVLALSLQLPVSLYSHCEHDLERCYLFCLHVICAYFHKERTKCIPCTHTNLNIQTLDHGGERRLMVFALSHTSVLASETPSPKTSGYIHSSFSNKLKTFLFFKHCNYPALSFTLICTKCVLCSCVDVYIIC